MGFYVYRTDSRTVKERGGRMNCKKMTDECKTCGARDVYCDLYRGYKQGIDDLASELKLKCLENMYHSVTLQQIFEIKERLKGGK